MFLYLNVTVSHGRNFTLVSELTIGTKRKKKHIKFHIFYYFNLANVNLTFRSEKAYNDQA